MSIELHCPNCSKLIKAPDNAGGKQGKCPYCQNKVYIPTPAGEGEEISLAPLDDEAERREEAMRAESSRFAATIGLSNEAPAGTQDDAGDGPPVIDVAEGVEQFIYAMRDSKLEDAEKIVARLKKNSAKAKDYIDGIMVDPTPPDFDGLPKPLVQGFLKTLRGRLG